MQVQRLREIDRSGDTAVASSRMYLTVKMDRDNRAKQFMPFDALKGFREALAERERIVVPKRELSEEMKQELDLTFHKLKKLDIVNVQYFENGEYVMVTGVVSKIDESGRFLIIVDTKIAFDDITDMQIVDKV